MTQLEQQKISVRVINPLWIISLFFSFTEVILGYAVFKTTGGIQISLTVFVLAFPILVASAFFLVLWHRPEHLYAPKDFYNDDSFLKSLSGSFRKQKEMQAGIYLDTEENSKIEKTYLAVQQLVETMGFSKTKEEPPQKGSWFKKFMIGTKKAVSENELEETFNTVKEDFILKKNFIRELENEANGLQPKKSEESAQSEAIGNILSSIQNIERAVIRIGSLVVIKTKDSNNESKLNIFSLNDSQLEYLNKNSNLLKNPEDMLRILNELSEGNVKYP